MLSILLLVGGFLIVEGISQSTAHADEVYTFIVKKQEKKDQNRWSLANWIEQRDRMRLMDLWLHIHSPSPYEFYFSGDYQISTTRNSTPLSFDAAAYASIFGLHFQYTLNPIARVLSLFELRIFGVHSQGTNITLHGGVGIREFGGGRVRQAVAGGSLTFYLARWLGLDGMYQHFFQSTRSVQGTTQGSRWEAGAFLEFSALRLFGNYFQEKENPSLLEASTRKGIRVGMKFFL